ncbi:hypothetical protein [Archangium lansingense]|uniref:Uncharacterized protein n=1 Tax=Archangium lansingense TaxID=2995310 RepID=A0ABT4AD29_9BACT|nr:hypothetical protein [Archangium lansinium]MCY1079578.1 hypothetical protein [Archangium lansinium]
MSEDGAKVEGHVPGHHLKESAFDEKLQRSFAMLERREERQAALRSLLVLVLTVVFWVLQVRVKAIAGWVALITTLVVVAYLGLEGVGIVRRRQLLSGCRGQTRRQMEWHLRRLGCLSNTRIEELEETAKSQGGTPNAIIELAFQDGWNKGLEELLVRPEVNDGERRVIKQCQYVHGKASKQAAGPKQDSKWNFLSSGCAKRTQEDLRWHLKQLQREGLYKVREFQSFSWRTRERHEQIQRAYREGLKLGLQELLSKPASSRTEQQAIREFLGSREEPAEVGTERSEPTTMH